MRKFFFSFFLSNLEFLLSLDQVQALSWFSFPFFFLSFTFTFSPQIFVQFLMYMLQLKNPPSRSQLDTIYLLMQLSNIRAPKSKTVQATLSGQSNNIQAPELNLVSAPCSNYVFHIQKDAASIQAAKTKSTSLFLENTVYRAIPPSLAETAESVGW